MHLSDCTIYSGNDPVMYVAGIVHKSVEIGLGVHLRSALPSVQIMVQGAVIAQHLVAHGQMAKDRPGDAAGPVLIAPGKLAQASSWPRPRVFWLGGGSLWPLAGSMVYS